MRLSQRQENILLSLKKFDFLTRDHLRRLHHLGSIRNSNKVLLSLKPYLNSFRDGYDSVYYLSKLGREYVGCDKIRKKSSSVNHILARNSFYIHAGCPTQWKNEVKISDGENTIVMDAWFKSQNNWSALEVDLTQPMKENRKKAKAYEGLYQRGRVSKQLGHFPVVTFITTTEYRRKQLRDACKNFPSVIYTLEDIK